MEMQYVQTTKAPSLVRVTEDFLEMGQDAVVGHFDQIFFSFLSHG